LTSHASSREAVHILIDFRTRMIGFLFGGPDSGQQLGRRWTWRFVMKDRRFGTVSY
jgi:hypothetical protein